MSSCGFTGKRRVVAGKDGEILNLMLREERALGRGGQISRSSPGLPGDSPQILGSLSLPGQKALLVCRDLYPIFQHQETTKPVVSSELYRVQCQHPDTRPSHMSSLPPVFTEAFGSPVYIAPRSDFCSSTDSVINK